ncbi:CRISPR-associated endonuclease Cas1 [Candidatus Methylacidiphilum fumarolicum]|uniref:CRISPR-associated endonuclease Cas1 n=2 Tax=Candidatus Methylacidiphilum fumarolicum TaxID=591154 RepID=I0JZ06_METFB|nr:CRISPR-associated endonuclease Cas1 [Candidatus Methylacidiphilum fumarolicum]MBW6414643.1 CRISPR-associated endonuclease Cas1 [Candidatus Methylacidiphilum fumarolicum]TFE65663.1 CRISPR-associated endonuclease Cas1 [Candidatus Methylacidiphilum fumarolicum]TFE74217.1 CRISPR-associated endonuclease Cas1 [Candidatus Methylacidiphilum fumarolicum]TFE75716.1 CRISPR-associated endonuclease Cas1 [Candidatus Methylacidiphilum fumarolicum]TFE75876.1 CRISPR-associated endonuclease Cas1 [Candidatus 
MPSAYILQTYAKVSLCSERLQVVSYNKENGTEELIREIPLRELERLVLDQTVSITTPALCELLLRNIPISFIGFNGQILGGFFPPPNSHGLWRLKQYQNCLDPKSVLAYSKQLVKAKIYNQRRSLQRLSSNRKINNENDIEWLNHLLFKVASAATVDEIRGYEGASTARYFQCWATFLPQEFPFERRSNRPPLNPVNACISFGATLLYNEMTALIHLHGLDPALGFLHAPENERWSLALDLIEPFRPVIVEALALDLFSHKILNKEHFEKKNGGCYLNELGRKKFLAQYETRLERQFQSEFSGSRTTLRAQLEGCVCSFKAALEDPSKFEPFLMN